MIGEKQARTPAQVRKRAQSQKKWLRTGIQAVFFLLSPALYSTAFSGVKYLFTQIGAGEPLAWNQFTQTLCALGVFTILFGRFFCGYACAFGGLGDWVFQISAWIQKKCKRKLPKIPEGWIPRLQWVKYGVLAVIVTACALGVYSGLTGWSPWDAFSMVTTAHLRGAGYVLAWVLLGLILMGMAVQERFFCQFLCPMGAVFALLPVMPWAVLRRNRENCIPRCSACQRSCPMHLSIQADGGKTGECIRCGKCAGICPKENIKGGVKKLRGDEVWFTLLRGALLLGAAVALGACRWISI